MKIYLAHNFDARLPLRETVVPFLESHGHLVTSRWVKDDSHVEGTGEFCAVSDLEDIDAASALLLYVDQFANKPGQGKWFEFGYALRAGKRIILIGEDNSCVFVNLPNVRRVHSIVEAEKFL